MVSVKSGILPEIGAAIARLRIGLGVSQREVANEAGTDQSRVSRIEKGEPGSEVEAKRVLAALASLGSDDARRYAAFLDIDWKHVERPGFWNPDAQCIGQVEETLTKVEKFFQTTDTPWPLQRQLERQTNLLAREAFYLNDIAHDIAFVGEIGVGKSTALSFLYGLLLPTREGAKLTDRVLLEAGAGGTTVCEVCIRRGPEYGMVVQAMPEAEFRQLVADLCTAKWARSSAKVSSSSDVVGVGREYERAIRNMAGLTTRRERSPDGKTKRRDLLAELIERCDSEEELRTKILDGIQLPRRTKREIWHDSAATTSPLLWLAEAFKAINNGRHRSFALPTVNRSHSAELRGN